MDPILRTISGCQRGQEQRSQRRGIGHGPTRWAIKQSPRCGQVEVLHAQLVQPRHIVRRVKERAEAVLAPVVLALEERDDLVDLAAPGMAFRWLKDNVGASKAPKEKYSLEMLQCAAKARNLRRRVLLRPARGELCF